MTLPPSRSSLRLMSSSASIRRELKVACNLRFAVHHDDGTAVSDDDEAKVIHVNDPYLRASKLFAAP